MNKSLIISLLFLSSIILLSLISIKNIEAIENITISKYNQSIKINDTTKVTDMNNMISVIVPKKWSAYGKYIFTDEKDIKMMNEDTSLTSNIDIIDHSSDPSWKDKLAIDGNITINSFLYVKGKEQPYNTTLGEDLLPLDSIPSLLLGYEGENIRSSFILEKDEYGKKYVIDGIPAAYIIFQESWDTMPYLNKFYIKLIAIKDLDEINIDANIDEGSFAENRPVFEEIIKSIEIIPIK